MNVAVVSVKDLFHSNLCSLSIWENEVKSSPDKSALTKQPLVSTSVPTDKPSPPAGSFLSHFWLWPGILDPLVENGNAGRGEEFTPKDHKTENKWLHGCRMCIRWDGDSSERQFVKGLEFSGIKRWILSWGKWELRGIRGRERHDQTCIVGKEKEKWRVSRQLRWSWEKGRVGRSMVSNCSEGQKGRFAGDLRNKTRLKNESLKVQFWQERINTYFPIVNTLFELGFLPKIEPGDFITSLVLNSNPIIQYCWPYPLVETGDQGCSPCSFLLWWKDGQILYSEEQSSWRKYRTQGSPEGPWASWT